MEIPYPEYPPQGHTCGSFCPPDEPDVHCEPPFPRAWATVCPLLRPPSPSATLLTWVTACSLFRSPAPLPELKITRAKASKDASQQKAICFVQAEAHPNIQSEDDKLAQRSVSALEHHKNMPLHSCDPSDCQGASHLTENHISYEGTGDPDATTSGVGHSGLWGSPSPANLLRLAYHKGPYHQGPWVQSPSLQISGPTGHSPAADIHFMTSRDTSFQWFGDCKSYPAPAVRGELTPSVSFTHWIGSIPKCGAHRFI